MTPSHDKTEEPDKRAELLGKVLSLKDLVRYERGTVSSRMIIDREAGSVTVFSFDKGEGLSEHTAPFEALVTVLDGECKVRIGGTAYRLKEGDAIIFPANVPHAVSATTQFKMMLTMIRG